MAKVYGLSQSRLGDSYMSLSRFSADEFLGDYQEVEVLEPPKEGDYITDQEIDNFLSAKPVRGGKELEL